MKALRGLLLLALVVVFAGGALADPIKPTVKPKDPTITVRGGGTGTPIKQEEGGNRFNFTVDENGGGTFVFTNMGGNIMNLAFVMALPEGFIFCSSDVFEMCGVQFLPGGGGGGGDRPHQSTGQVVILFTGPPGIPSGSSFTVNLGTSGWVAGSSSHALANVPEPGTLSLFLVGVGALVARRKRRL